MRIAVAMSGGVDSSVAAALLQRAGHEVAGITLRLVPGDTGCCSLGGARRAARVAATLGISHYVWDFTELFEHEVIAPFCEGYFEARTLNPCLVCNGTIKFSAMLDRVLGLGFDALATGHYARLLGAGSDARAHRGADNELERPVLARAIDADKDQSYALYMVPTEVLARVRFPLGGLTKAQVRAVARGLGLASAETAESQDICFVTSGSVADYVLAHAGRDAAPGSIVDEQGRVLAQHLGVHRFTIGQRRGTGVAAGQRRYVVDLQPETARVVVGPRELLMVDDVRFEDCRWHLDEPDGPVEVMTRYRGPTTPGQLATDGRTAGVTLESPMARPSPGQAVVCYRGDVVVGGGIAC